MAERLLIIGAGQYGQVVREVAIATGRYEMINFLDDNCQQAIGGISEFAKIKDKYTEFIVAIGKTDVRKKLLEFLMDENVKVATLIHPKSYVSSSAKINYGCVIEPQTVIHTESVVETRTYVSAGTIINHNTKVGKYCHLDVDVIVGSNENVPDGVKVEKGSVYVLKENNKC